MGISSKLTEQTEEVAPDTSLLVEEQPEKRIKKNYDPNKVPFYKKPKFKT